jgi:anaerobic magnesium-protoporphyrin IX monomethyl ester cyclase
MRIGLLYPEWTGAYGIMGYFARRNSTWPPLNLALIGAILEKCGHDVFIIDGQYEGLSPEKLAAKAVAKNPRLIGFTATSPFFGHQRLVAEEIKRIAPNIITVVGGPHVSIVKQEALLNCFDYGFVGEVEKTLQQFLQELEGGRDVSHIKGLLFKRDGQVIFTGDPQWEEDLDSLPFPARHLLPMGGYRLGTLQGRLSFTSIQMTRGCPWKCIFCASENLNTTLVRRRSAEKVVAEIEHVVDTWGIRHFYFVDDVLTLHEEHILEVCDLIEQKKLRITFEGSTRANLINEASVKRMAECGLIRLSFGLETVDTEMRKTMKKKVPLQHYVTANKLLNDYNVEALNSVMIGLPGETRETINKTLDFLANTREVKQANLAIAVPYPGTELHHMAATGEHGIKLLSDDFSKYRRYGTAVTEVNGLTPKDLVELQNEGFVRIYSAPWRWRPMFGKHGVIGALLMLLRVGRLVVQKAVRRAFGDWQPPRLATNAGSLPAGHLGSPKSPNF